jgi:RNA polymerase sigma-70 factor (ECF subfamily)
VAKAQASKTGVERGEPAGALAALETAFATILDEYGPALRRIARVYGRRGRDEEDLYQELLLQVWRSLPSFRGSARLGTWVYRVALNTGLKHRRSASKDLPDAGHRESCAGYASDTQREQRILERFLHDLGEVDRSVLLLYLDGLPQAEISEVTGLSAGAVGVRIHRMKRSFKQKFMESA